ncbi:MAG: VCBS repeat-containing protein, partial [Victivallales bacterium]
MNRKAIVSIICILTGILFCPLFNQLVSADAPTRILILPFDIFSDKDQSFLKNGIPAMLSTRLTTEKSVTVSADPDTQKMLSADGTPVSMQKASELASRFNADYVVFGSLTVFGEAISTDARLIDPKTQKALLTFNRTGSSFDEVISHMNLFADQIKEKAFGIGPVSSESASAPTAQSRVQQPSYLTHPDKIWEQESTQSVLNTESTYMLQQSRLGQIQKSRKFNTQVHSLAVGDVDGDGRNETVFIDANTLFIYRFFNNSFEKVAELSGKTTDDYLTVDTADINGNGKAEIFITSFSTHKERLNSFVTEWDGTGFQPICEAENRYFRVVASQSRGKVLYGQKRGMTDLFVSDVFELSWNGQAYVESQAAALPKGINIYEFAFGDVLNNGQEWIITSLDSGHVRLVDGSGNEEWKSSEPFGGNPVYLVAPGNFYADSGSYKKEFRYYLPQRIHVADTDSDGKN